MAGAIDIRVENKLTIEKRDINVYHHSRSRAYIISHGSSAVIPLKDLSKNDYLHLSIVRGPGDLRKECCLTLPQWVDFEFSTNGQGSHCNITLTHTNGIEGSDGTIILNIPPGPPVWGLKITRPPQAGTPNCRTVTVSCCPVPGLPIV